MSSAPGQPVTVTLAELTAIRTALTEKAHGLRAHADYQGRREPAPLRAGMRARALAYEDLAARLAFASPGEPIQVVSDPADAIPADIPAGPGRD